MKIPFFNTAMQYNTLKNEILDKCDSVFSSGQVLQGIDIKELENNICKIHNVKHAVAVSSGTDALHFSLIANNIGPGSKVAVTSLSFLSSASVICQVGAEPVFVDINTDDFCMSTNHLMHICNEINIDAVIAVHLYGQTCNIEKIQEICRGKNIVLIEDGCQAINATFNGKKIGFWGSTACISFDPTKPINAFGSGGIVLSNDSYISEQIRKLRYHGRNKSDYNIIGYNHQISSIQAGIINIKLKHMDEWEDKRIGIASEYTKGLEDISKIKTPVTMENRKHIFHKYVLKVYDRDNLVKYLIEKGIDVKIHYPNPIYKFSVFKDYNNANLSAVEMVCNEVLSLPIYPELNSEQISFVVESIRSFYKK